MSSLSNLNLFLLATFFVATICNGAFIQGSNEAQVRVKRMMGSSEVNIRDHPYIVVMSIPMAEDSDLYNTCAGTILSKQWIVTVAQCAPDMKNIKIRPGTNHVGGAGRTHRVDRIIRHEFYNGETKENDIALIKVTPDFDFKGQTTKSIDMIEFDVKPVRDQYGTVVGYGQTGLGPRHLHHSWKLQSIDLPIRNVSDCSKLCNEKRCRENMILCAGYTDNIQMFWVEEPKELSWKSPCKTDYGDPLVIGGKLAGIFSIGPICSDTIIDGLRPGIYTSIAAYHSWIDKHMT